MIDRETAINILKKYTEDPIGKNIQEAHIMAIMALLNEEDLEFASTWHTLEEKEPVSGEICIVMYEGRGLNKEPETNYERAVYFRKGYTVTNYDGTPTKITKSGFYVPMDPRPLGIYYGYAACNYSFGKYQVNDAPYIPKEHEKWGDEYCNLESEGINE